MRIGLDLSPAVQHHAGIGRYAFELAVAMLRVDPRNEYLAFYNAPTQSEVPDAPLDQLPRHTIRLSNKPWRMCVSLGYLLAMNLDRWLPTCDVFHATDHLLPPVRHARTVFTVFDVTFLLYPQYHLPLNRWYLSLMMPHFLKRADAIIAVSECSKRDVLRVYDIVPEKIRVIYAGVAPAFRPIDSRTEFERVRAKYQLPPRFILYFGTIEPRKNLLTLLDAFQALLQKNGRTPHLVIAGQRGWLFQPVLDRVRALGLEGQVHFTGRVDEADAPALMNLADVFVFPSLYEGFGLPPLEAMACGIPVICSNASSLPEIVGDAGILFEPRDTRGLLVAMSRVLENDGTKKELKELGLRQAQKFSWERAARTTLQVYEEARSQIGRV
jgi:glycosyltransferase involved in cell wall biosynthesis